MNRKKVEYSIFNKYYDEINVQFWEDYKIKCKDLLNEKTFRYDFAYDYGCGTGQGVNFLYELGFKKVKGIDLSKEMIKIAKKKFKNAEFFVGDMISYSGWVHGDLAICSFDAINYLTKKNDWIIFFDSVSKSLKRGGVFLFDTLTEYDHKKIWPTSTRVIEKKDYVLINHGKYINELALMYYSWFIRQENNQYTKYIEIHKQKSYPVYKIRNWLEQSNFGIEKIIDAQTGNKVRIDSQRLIFKCIRL